MGCSWASLVAQSVMTAVVREAGVTDAQFLHAESGLPPQGQPAVSVATDDVICFEQANPQAIAAETVSPVFANLDRVWRTHHIAPKSTKIVDRAANGTALGIDLVSAKLLLPKRGRLYELVSGLIYLFTYCRASPTDCGHFFGVSQWLLLMNRPMLACCGAIYKFIDAVDKTARNMPSGPLEDLALVACLLPALVVDLRATWTPFITASDGAESYGYGGTKASCDQCVTRSLASLGRTFPHAFITTDPDTLGVLPAWFIACQLLQRISR